MKKLLLYIAIPLVIIIGALLALVLLVNPNQFKPLIVEQAQKQTGLELIIEGDISWQFYPSIGFELGKTELRNPQGFSQPNMFKVDTVGVDVSVMPLLSQQLEIGNVTLTGAEFYLETLKDGRKNIDVLTQAQTTQVEAAATATDTPSPEASTENAPSESSPSPVSAWTINLAGVTVSNAAVEIQDKQAGSYTKLYDVSLNLSEFAIDTWTKAEFAAKGENNQQKFTAQGSAEFKLAKGFAEYALRNIDLNASFSDPATKMDSIKLGLETFEFDKANALTYSLAGQAAGLDINMKGAGALMVDTAISKVVMNKLTLDATFKGDALPQSPMKVDMASDLTFDLTKSHLSFVLETLTANALAFDGKADVTLGDIPKVRFALHSPNIDLDEFLGLNKPAENASQPDTSGPANTDSTSSNSDPVSTNSAAASSSKPQAEVEPDLSALKTLDVKGDITIDKFKASNARMQNVTASFYVNRGIAELTSFSSNLYQGSITATAKLDARKSPASYTAKKQIKGVKVLPLLKDVANNDMLEGTGNIDVDVKGSSLTQRVFRKTWSGL